MKALFYTGTMEMEIRDAAEPVAQAGDCIVDVSHCGICGSDMHAFHGHDPRRVPPMILGHEIAGTVLDGALAGKRVVVNPLMECGTCEMCTAGMVHLCPTRSMVGMARPGGFAQRIGVLEKNAIVIPDDLDFETAALAEPLACSVHAAMAGLTRISKTPQNARVAVLGGGAIGLLCAMVFADAGVDDLWIAETNPLRGEMLEAVVKAKTYDPRDGGPELASCDIVLDAVGSGRTRAASTSLVRPGGMIVHIGLQDNEPGLDTRTMTLQEIGFMGVYCYTPDDFAEAIAMLADRRVTGTGWSEVRPLDEGARSFHDVHEGKAPPKIILSC